MDDDTRGQPRARWNVWNPGRTPENAGSTRTARQAAGSSHPSEPTGSYHTVTAPFTLHPGGQARIHEMSEFLNIVHKKRETLFLQMEPGHSAELQ